ncbi:unnamed protein product [Somion occarium]|uniref:Pentatricopeptide repeat-containing protein n=1 Tax=Somion occarium TaxID=3059160 RepID=A0ABP1E976_9APHY
MPPTPDNLPLSSEHTTPMTPAQMSRAASHAVRLCVRSGAVMEACYILNSLHGSIEDGPGGLGPLEDIGPMPEGLKPITFGQEVSPRLSSHCFLHAMVRAGSVGRAARFAELMMARGTRMRSKTLEAIIQGLCSDPQSQIKAKAIRLADIAKQGRRPPMLELDADCVNDAYTRAAIRILQIARKYSQRRTERMFSTIIGACLLQGEIIVGCLLFVLLVKDWQARHAMLTPVDSGDANSEETVQGKDKGRLYRLRQLDHNQSTPKVSSMTSILQEIEAVLAKRPQEPEDHVAFEEALQALANLAMLVEQGLAPFPQLSPLLRAFWSCPKVPHRVWILQDNAVVQVKAYDYFHEVLLRIIYSLKHYSDPPLRLPQLDRVSYNSLLHYALRHRISPGLADSVLRHMLEHRKRPLKPDVGTYNVLLRSSTLLRNSDMATAVIHAFRRDTRNQKLMPEDEPSVPKTKECIPYRMRQIVRRYPDTYETSTWGERRDSYRDIARTVVGLDVKLPADNITVSSYIMHLTSTGRPHLVALLIFRLIPELHIVDHPSGADDAEQKERRKENREACLKRAASFGPHFFAAVLNALVKAGKTGLAERVWLLALQAQRASWIPGFVENVKPWCLTIHSYTSMMQCYAREACRPMPIHMLDSATVPDWTPRDNLHVRGWAGVVHMRQALQKVPRRMAGRRMGMMVFRSLASGGEDVLHALRDLRKFGPEIEIPPESLPVPDARFFNAALMLFGRDPSLAKHRSANQWRRRLDFSMRSFSRYGTVARLPHPALQEIGEAMVANGYSIPPAFRHFFVGRLPVGLLADWNKPEFDYSPYAFPPTTHLPYRSNRIPVTKTRGLPVRRRIRRPRRTRNNSSANVY